MLTKKNDIIDELVREFALPWSVIDLIYSFYWKHGVKQDIKDIAHIDLYIPNIGSFNLVKSKIGRLKEIAEDKQNEEFTKKIENAEKLILERHETKNKKRELRKKNLEEQTKNS